MFFSLSARLSKHFFYKFMDVEVVLLPAPVRARSKMVN